MQGDVFTDFDVESLSDPPEVRRDRGRFVMNMNRTSAFRVGAGGDRHSFNTLNGDILRTEGKLMSNRIGIFALLTGATCAISGIAVAQDQRLVVPLSDPSRPARLEIALFSGDITVEAYDGNEVVIVADAPIRGGDEDEPPREDGLRRIQSSSVGLTVEENDNTVSVRMDFSPKNVDIADSRAAADVRATRASSTAATSRSRA